MKATNPDKVAAFLSAAGRETSMAEKVTKSLADATPADIAEVLKALTPEQLQPVIEAVNTVVENVESKGGDNAPGGAAPAKPAPFTPGKVNAEEGVELYNADGQRVDATGTPLAPEDELLKSLGGKADEKTLALFKSMQADITKSREAAERAEATANIEKAARLDAEAVDVFKSAYPHLGMKVTEVAPAIRKFAAAEPETAKAITDLLKSLEGQAAEGIFKELGTTGNGQETDAQAKIDAAVAEIQKAAPGLTHSAALLKALDNDPSLYTDYEAAQKGGNR